MKKRDIPQSKGEIGDMRKDDVKMIESEGQLMERDNPTGPKLGNNHSRNIDNWVQAQKYIKEEKQHD